MAYDTKQLIKVIEGGPNRQGVFLYMTADATGTVDTAGYISDATVRGMQKGDLVIRTTLSAMPTTNADLATAAGSAPTVSSIGLHVVMGISTAGAADLADTLAITVTNTD